MKISQVIALIISVGLSGCAKSDQLAHYYGVWEIDAEHAEGRIKSGITPSGISPEMIDQILKAYSPRGSLWIIEDGKILLTNADYDERVVISMLIITDNINFAEVLVDLPLFGHCVVRLEIRDDFLNVYVNPSRELLHRYRLAGGS